MKADEDEKSRESLQELLHFAILFILLILLALYLPAPERPGPLTPPESLYAPRGR